ncbi:MAG: hypothetical protein NWF04_05075 [Candidatus Bathyarchaeota archaeon]|nr:hypothetical protein [Candidatus Bathyarchaeota archaeon]
MTLPLFDGFDDVVYFGFGVYDGVGVADLGCIVGVGSRYSWQVVCVGGFLGFFYATVEGDGAGVYDFYGVKARGDVFP